MKNMKIAGASFAKRVGILGAFALASAGAAMADLEVTAATAAITDATAKGTTVIMAGFAIGAVFLVARVIRRGMHTVG